MYIITQPNLRAEAVKFPPFLWTPAKRHGFFSTFCKVEVAKTMKIRMLELGAWEILKL